MPSRGSFAITPFGQATGGGPGVAAANLPVLTPEELKNGWTPERLARYRMERDRAAYSRLFMPTKQRPQRTAQKYDPFKW